MEAFFSVVRILAIMVVSTSACAGDAITPERFNKGPRVLFNLNSQEDEGGLEEIVSGRFFQKYWHGPRLTIQHGLMRRGEKGHVQTVVGYHGEEVLVMIQGTLRFTFPDSGKVFEIGPGDVFHFPNILHGGECIADACQFLGIYTPNRPDFGPEGTRMTAESNQALQNAQ